MAHHGGRGYTKTKQIRKERRERAALVAEESGWSKLSLQEQLAKLPADGAKKQRARILDKLEKQAQEVAQKAAQREAEQAKKDAEKSENPKKKTHKK